VLRELGREIWLADGPPVLFLGIFDYPTRMAVVRLADGGLWVWSPIELDEQLASELEGLGPVRHLVAPNKLHHLYLGAWHERFPAARLYAAPGLARKRTDLAFDAQLGDAPDPTWGREIEHVVFRGSFALEEVVFLHRASRTALVCDLIQRFAPETQRGWRGAWLRLWGVVGENGSTPLEWRASFWQRRIARAALQRALGWDAERLVIAHGELPTEPGSSALARGLRWLA
jgi:hypothetical protein